MTHPSGLPYADASHEKCAEAVRLRELFLPLLAARQAEVAPRPHHRLIDMYDPDIYEVKIILKVNILTEVTCHYAIDNMIVRVRDALGDLNAKFVWRIPLELTVYVDPIVHADPDGEHIDPISDARVTVTGAELIFKARARYKIDR